MKFYALASCRGLSPAWFAPRSANRARVRGFTLVELIVGLAVLGLLTAVAAPSLQQLLAGQAVDAQAGEMQASMRLARSEALKRGVEVSVCASSTGTSCGDATAWKSGWIAFADSDNDGVYDAGEVIVRVQSEVKGVKGVTTTAKSLTFARSGILLKDGAALAQDAQIKFYLEPVAGGSKAARTVCVNKQGRVASLKGDATCL